MRTSCARRIERAWMKFSKHHGLENLELAQAWSTVRVGARARVTVRVRVRVRFRVRVRVSSSRSVLGQSAGILNGPTIYCGAWAGFPVACAEG